MGVINIITDGLKEGDKNKLASSSVGTFDTYDAFVRLADKEGDFSYSLNGSFNKSRCSI